MRGPAPDRRRRASRELEPHAARHRRRCTRPAPGIADFAGGRARLRRGRRARRAARVATGCEVQRRRARPRSLRLRPLARRHRGRPRDLLRRRLGRPPRGRRRRRPRPADRALPRRLPAPRARAPRPGALADLPGARPVAAVPRRPPDQAHRRRGPDRADRADGRGARRLPPARPCAAATCSTRSPGRAPGGCSRAGGAPASPSCATRRCARPSCAPPPATCPSCSATTCEAAFAGVRAQALGRDGRLVDDFVFSQHRARAARAQRALAGRHLLAGDRPPRRRRGRAGVRPRADAPAAR